MSKNIDMLRTMDSGNVSESQLNKLSNALITSTSNELTELIIGLMEDSSSGDVDMWKDRAVAMIDAVMRALVWKRDNQGLLLDIEVLRDSILFENIQKMAKSDDLPPDIITSLNGYLQSVLQSVPDCLSEKEEAQDAFILEQHGFVTMQFTRVITALSN